MEKTKPGRVKAELGPTELHEELGDLRRNLGDAKRLLGKAEHLIGIVDGNLRMLMGLTEAGMVDPRRD